MKETFLNFLYRLLKVLPFLETRINFINKLPPGGKLLDAGCGSGKVLKRFLSVRPDIKITGVDKHNFSHLIPANIVFHELDLVKESLPYPDGYFDGVSLIHLIEHLEHPEIMLAEAFRVLKSGGRFYLETPHIKSVLLPSLNFLPNKSEGPFNFYDDPTHIRPYPKQTVRKILGQFYPTELRLGIYRNYIYTFISPFLIFFGLLRLKRRWVIVGLHNLIGWSMYYTGRKGIDQSAGIANPRKRRVATIINRGGRVCYKTLTWGGLIKPSQNALSLIHPRSILVIRVDHIGDVMMSTPVYPALKKKYPQAKITVLVGSWAAELLKYNPYVDRIITIDCPWWSGTRRSGRQSILKFIQKYRKILSILRRQRFDIGIDLRADFRHILLFLFIPGVKNRLSYDRSGGEYLLTKAPPYEGLFAIPEMEKNRRLLQELGVEMKSASPQLWWGKEESDSGAICLQKERLKTDTFKVIISPSARSPLRTWRPERFGQLADWITEEFQGQIILVGSSGDRDLIRNIEDRMRNKPINLAGKTTLLEVAALCDSCQLFLGVEGGLMHIAAATGIPILALYGPMKPELTSPERADFHVVYQAFPCSPCLQLECPYSSSSRGECMEAIRLEDAKKAIGKIMEVPPFSSE